MDLFLSSESQKILHDSISKHHESATKHLGTQRGEKRLEIASREDIDENLIFQTYNTLRATEERSVKETKSPRRKRQKHSNQSRISYPSEYEQKIPSNEFSPKMKRQKNFNRLW